MRFAYDHALGILSAGTLTGDVRALLVMTGTSADEEKDVQFMSQFHDLDECDGDNHARQVLDHPTWAVDTAQNRFVFDAEPIVFASLGAGTRQNAALLIYLHVTDDTDSKPLLYIDGAGFPFDGNGENVTLNPHANGIALVANKAA